MQGMFQSPNLRVFVWPKFLEHLHQDMLRPLTTTKEMTTLKTVIITSHHCACKLKTIVSSLNKITFTFTLWLIKGSCYHNFLTTLETKWHHSILLKHLQELMMLHNYNQKQKNEINFVAQKKSTMFFFSCIIRFNKREWAKVSNILG